MAIAGLGGLANILATEDFLAARSKVIAHAAARTNTAAGSEANGGGGSGEKTSLPRNSVSCSALKEAIASKYLTPAGPDPAARRKLRGLTDYLDAVARAK